MNDDKEQELVRLRSELENIESRRQKLLRGISEREVDLSHSGDSQQTKTSITSHSPIQDKIKLFRSLFRGREDVYPRRFESIKTGKSGYQPACKYEWTRGICGKPRVKCSDCESREYLPVTDEVIEWHLRGENPYEYRNKDFTIGVYPLL